MNKTLSTSLNFTFVTLLTFESVILDHLSLIGDVSNSSKSARHDYKSHFCSQGPANDHFCSLVSRALLQSLPELLRLRLLPALMIIKLAGIHSRFVLSPGWLALGTILRLSA